MPAQVAEQRDVRGDLWHVGVRRERLCPDVLAHGPELGALGGGREGRREGEVVRRVRGVGAGGGVGGRVGRGRRGGGGTGGNAAAGAAVSAYGGVRGV